MTIRRLVCTAALAVFAGTASVGAQDARPEDVSTIDGIIAAYYDVISGPAGEAPDVARDQSLHHPDAWVAIANTAPDGSKTVNVMSLAEYHGDGGPRAQPFYEWETERTIQRSGDMVHVWSHYASSREPNGEVFDTGVNSITLLWDGARWWVMGWMFDQTAN